MWLRRQPSEQPSGLVRSGGVRDVAAKTAGRLDLDSTARLGSRRVVLVWFAFSATEPRNAKNVFVVPARLSIAVGHGTVRHSLGRLGGLRRGHIARFCFRGGG